MEEFQVIYVDSPPFQNMEFNPHFPPLEEAGLFVMLPWNRVWEKKNS